MEILKEEISSLKAVKTKLQEKIKDQEDEIKKLKEDLEKKNSAAKEEDEVVICFFIVQIIV